MVQANFAPVYRYAYGAFFDELQVFPNAGVWHTTERTFHPSILI